MWAFPTTSSTLPRNHVNYLIYLSWHFLFLIICIGIHLNHERIPRSFFFLKNALTSRSYKLSNKLVLKHSNQYLKARSTFLSSSYKLSKEPFKHFDVLEAWSALISSSCKDLDEPLKHYDVLKAWSVLINRSCKDRSEPFSHFDHLKIRTILVSSSYKHPNWPFKHLDIFWNRKHFDNWSYKQYKNHSSIVIS